MRNAVDVRHGNVRFIYPKEDNCAERTSNHLLAHSSLKFHIKINHSIAMWGTRTAYRTSLSLVYHITQSLISTFFVRLRTYAALLGRKEHEALRTKNELWGRGLSKILYMNLMRSMEVALCSMELFLINILWELNTILYNRLNS